MNDQAYFITRIYLKGELRFGFFFLILLHIRGQCMCSLERYKHLKILIFVRLLTSLVERTRRMNCQLLMKYSSNFLNHSR